MQAESSVVASSVVASSEVAMTPQRWEDAMTRRLAPPGLSADERDQLETAMDQLETVRIPLEVASQVGPLGAQ